MTGDRVDKKYYSVSIDEREDIWNLTQRMRKRVAAAAAGFVGRWLCDTLRLVDADLHEAIVDQEGMLNRAYLEGDKQEITVHGLAMARGWRRAAQIMLKSGMPDDAYLLCQDRHSEFVVAIVRCENPDPERMAAVMQRVGIFAGPHVLVRAPHDVAASLAMIREAEIWCSPDRLVGVRPKQIPDVEK